VSRRWEIRLPQATPGRTSDGPHLFRFSRNGGSPRPGLSNGFSRKLRNHEAAVNLNYFAYNFVRIHKTLSMSPAMQQVSRIDCGKYQTS
jgi:hypothetical protein